MAVAGYGGAVKTGANVIADAQTWSMDAEIDMLESTALRTSGGAKQYVPGLFGASGKIEAKYNVNGDVNGQKALHQAFFNRTKIALDLETDDNGGGTYSGQAWVNKISPKADVGGTADIGFEFTFDGAVTFA